MTLAAKIRRRWTGRCSSFTAGKRGDLIWQNHTLAPLAFRPPTQTHTHTGTARSQPESCFRRPRCSTILDKNIPLGLSASMGRQKKVSFCGRSNLHHHHQPDHGYIEETNVRVSQILDGKKLQLALIFREGKNFHFQKKEIFLIACLRNPF